MTSVLDHALAMAEQGFRVFPLSPRLTADSKFPAKGISWPAVATVDKVKIRQWFGPKGAYRDCGYGIAMGNGWAVFDADVKDGAPGLASMELAKLLDVEFSLVVATPTGGRHGYFKTDGVPLVNGVKNVDGYPGVDIRSDGGFVVGPGSVRDDGLAYKIVEENPNAAGAEQDFLNKLRIHAPRQITQGKAAVMPLDLPESVEMATRWLKDEAPESVQGAGGGKVLIFVAAQLKDFAISETLAKELIAEHYNEHKAFPPWDPDELDQKVENGFKYGKNAPGSKNYLAEFGAVEIAERVDLKVNSNMLPAIDAASLTGDPPIREWIVPGAVPKGEVTLLYGDGGLGKTLLAQQLATSMIAGRPWLGLAVRPGRVLAIFCEDDTNELWRRQRAINKSLGVEHFDHDAFLWASADHVAAMGGMMMTFAEGGEGKITKFYRAVEARIADFRPDLVIVDPLANVYGGKEQDRGQATFFVNRALKALCVKYATTVMALAHPSLTGMESGRGSSGSTAWNNAVRSRLYLTRPKNDPSGDYRQLDGMKSNYAKTGHIATVRWREGAFVLATDGEDDPCRVAERALLAAMRILIDRGVALSPAPRVGNYVVRLVLSLPETQGLGRSELEHALERVLRSGNVVINKQPDDKRRLRDVLKIVFDPDQFDALDEDLEA